MKLTGMNDVLRNLNKEVNAIKQRTLAGLIKGAIIVRRDMEFTPPKIPVDTGNMRSSFMTVTSEGRAADGANASFKGKAASQLAADHTSSVAAHQREAKSHKYPNIILGFTAYYTWFVHEMMGANYGRFGAGAKFFEASFKRNRDRILKVIAEEAKIKK